MAVKGRGLRIPRFCCLLGCILVASCAPARALDFEVVRVASSLSRPLFVTAPPGDRERIFIVEQDVGNPRTKRGRISILHLASGAIAATPFLEVPGISWGGELGLLGLAFHPRYASNGYFYVDYTASQETHIVRYQVSADPDLADASSATRVMRFAQPTRSHNAGWMGFGPDGYLYISSGDGGEPYDADDNAQTVVLNVLGKILRIDVDGDDFPDNDSYNHAIPPDNPFVGVPLAAEQIWAYGLRNPWRASFDRQTGDLWIGDVGEGSREEIDFQPADSPGGENYGWRLRSRRPHGRATASTWAARSPRTASIPFTSTATMLAAAR